MKSPNPIIIEVFSLNRFTKNIPVTRKITSNTPHKRAFVLSY